jgi:hypothetical protein
VPNREHVQQSSNSDSERAGHSCLCLTRLVQRRPGTSIDFTNNAVDCSASRANPNANAGANRPAPQEQSPAWRGQHILRHGQGCDRHSLGTRERDDARCGGDRKEINEGFD